AQAQYGFNFAQNNFSPVSAPDRITDFNAAEGDLIVTGITTGLAGSTPIVWKGTANAGFTAAAGQSLAMAGSNPANASIQLELWTFYDAAADQTVLFMDRNRDFVVDGNDFKLVLDGHVALGAASFTAGTFNAIL